MPKKTKKPKKKSRTKIGHEHEEEYEQIMNADGWLTHTTQMARGWEKNKDMYNLFDIIGLKKEGIKLVQVKTTNLGNAVKDIQEWARKNRDRLPHDLVLEVALKKYATKRKVARWRIHNIPLDEKLPIFKYDIRGREHE